MGKMTYGEQLKHPNWQRKRLEMLESADFMCRSCGSKDNTLHVHHKKYVKGRMAWEYENTELDVLCEDCHKKSHDGKEVLDAIVSDLTPDVIPYVTALIAGYLFGGMDIDEAQIKRARQGCEFHFELGMIISAISSLGPVKWRIVAKRSLELDQKDSGLVVNPAIRAMLESWEK